MRAIPTQAIARARTHMGGLLTDTCTVYRPATIRGTSGGTKPVKVDDKDPVVNDNVPVRVELMEADPSGSLPQAERENYVDASHNVYFRFDADVTEGDWIDVDGRNVQLNIVSISDQQTDGYLLQANAREHG